MKSRPMFSVPVVVLVAVAALLVGSIGSAVAGPALTKGKVKSIASKVVKKTAPTLSVAHAASADTATNATDLGGQPASSYLKNYYIVGFTQADGTTLVTKNLPSVPNGTYQVTMNISATLSAPDTFTCVLKNGGTIVLAAPAPLDQTTFAGINAARVVTVSGPLSVQCTVAGGATFTSPISFGYPQNAITFMRLDTGTSLGTANRGVTGTARPGGPTGS